MPITPHFNRWLAASWLFSARIFSLLDGVYFEYFVLVATDAHIRNFMGVALRSRSEVFKTLSIGFDRLDLSDFLESIGSIVLMICGAIVLFIFKFIGITDLLFSKIITPIWKAFIGMSWNWIAIYSLLIFTIILFVTFVSLIIYNIIVTRSIRSSIQLGMQGVIVVMVVSFALFVSVGIGPTVFWLVLKLGELADYYLTGDASIVVYAIVVLIGVGIVGTFFFAVYQLCQYAWPLLMQQFVRLGNRDLNADWWVAQVHKVDPFQQAGLIRMADPIRFHLDLEETIDLMGKVKKAVRDEPAISAFDAKLTELLALRRQRRGD
jgi:hypothetical protein